MAAPHSALDEALSALFALGLHSLRASRCSLFVRTIDEPTLHVHDQVGLPDIIGTDTIAGAGSISGIALSTQVPLLVRDIAAYPSLPAHPGRYATSSFVSVPILVESNAVGVLNVADRHDGGAFSEEDLRCAEMVTRCMATVLYAHLLARRAGDRDDVDPRTGLSNARHLQKSLGAAVEESRRADLPLSLLLLRIEDCHDLTEQTAALLAHCVTEMIGRLVGDHAIIAHASPTTMEEIAVILPETPPAAARHLARLILHEVRHDRLPSHLRYDCADMRISVGAATLPARGDGTVLLTLARDALRKVRSRGTGVLVGYTGPLTDPASEAATRDRLAVAGIPYLADPVTAATPEALRLLDADLAQAHLCCPIASETGALTLAMADPYDIDAVAAVRTATRMVVYPVYSPRDEILRTIATRMQGVQRLPPP